MPILNQPDKRPELVVIGGLADWMMLELRALYRVHDLEGVSSATERARLLAQATGAVAAITTGLVGIDAETVRQLPGLRLVACFGVGYDRVGQYKGLVEPGFQNRHAHARDGRMAHAIGRVRRAALRFDPGCGEAIYPCRSSPVFESRRARPTGTE